MKIGHDVSLKFYSAAAYEAEVRKMAKSSLINRIFKLKEPQR